jgi:hypothetical protein
MDIDITPINDSLRKIGKPAAKAPAAPAKSNPNASALKARIRALKDKVAALEAELRRVNGTERRLVRMVTRLP